MASIAHDVESVLPTIAKARTVPPTSKNRPGSEPVDKPSHKQGRQGRSTTIGRDGPSHGDVGRIQIGCDIRENR